MLESLQTGVCQKRLPKLTTASFTVGVTWSLIHGRQRYLSTNLSAIRVNIFLDVGLSRHQVYTATTAIKKVCFSIWLIRAFYPTLFKHLTLYYILNELFCILIRCIVLFYQPQRNIPFSYLAITTLPVRPLTTGYTH